MGLKVDRHSSLPGCSHIVHFYEEPGQLIEPLSSFVEEGLTRDESVVLIVVPERRNALMRRFRTEADRKRLVVFDARAVTDRISIHGKPDARRFDDFSQDILAATGGRSLRAFGEAVDVLARDGNFDGAILLEELWNKLLRKRSFPLY
jgi:hypothetical protein